MYIKYFLVLLALAEAWETSIKFPIKGDTSDPLLYTMYFMDTQCTFFRKAIGEHRAFYAPNVKTLKVYGNEYLKLEKIREYLKSAVNDITDCKSVLETSENIPTEGPLSEYGIEFPNPNIANALFLMLKNTAFIGDMYFHYPEMTLRVITEEDGWNDILDTSFNYILNMKNYMDRPAISLIFTTYMDLLNKVTEKK